MWRIYFVVTFYMTLQTLFCLLLLPTNFASVREKVWKVTGLDMIDNSGPAGVSCRVATYLTLVHCVAISHLLHQVLGQNLMSFKLSVET